MAIEIHHLFIGKTSSKGSFSDVRRRRGHWERAPRSFEGEVQKVSATEMRQEFKWTDSGRIWWWISHYDLEPPGELFDDIDTRGNRFNTHKLCKSKNHLVVRPDVAPQRWHNSVVSRVLQTWLPQILILRDKKHKSCCSGAPQFPQAEPWTRQRLIFDQHCGRTILKTPNMHTDVKTNRISEVPTAECSGSCHSTIGEGGSRQTTCIWMSTQTQLPNHLSSSTQSALPHLQRAGARPPPQVGSPWPGWLSRLAKQIFKKRST